MNKTNLEQKARLFSLFSDPTRLEIVQLLLENHDMIHVDKLVELIGKKEQPTISHHIRILRDAGLISGRKVGLLTYYLVNVKKIEEAYEFLIALSLIKEKTCAV